MMRDRYYTEGHGFLIVYSVIDSSSLQDAEDRYRGGESSILTVTVIQWKSQFINVVQNFYYAECVLFEQSTFLFQEATPQTCKPVILIGNKCDLENDRVISKEQGQAAANEWGGGRMKHYETSAKSNINVTEVIILIRAISKTWIRKNH